MANITGVFCECLNCLYPSSSDSFFLHSLSVLDLFSLVDKLDIYAACGAHIIAWYLCTLSASQHQRKSSFYRRSTGHPFFKIIFNPKQRYFMNYDRNLSIFFLFTIVQKIVGIVFAFALPRVGTWPSEQMSAHDCVPSASTWISADRPIMMLTNL